MTLLIVDQPIHRSDRSIYRFSKCDDRSMKLDLPLNQRNRSIYRSRKCDNRSTRLDEPINRSKPINYLLSIQRFPPRPSTRGVHAFSVPKNEIERERATQDERVLALVGRPLMRSGSETGGRAVMDRGKGRTEEGLRGARGRRAAGAAPEA